jgi:hypothetical protein
MDLQLIALCGLTFVIHLIGTLAYAVRIEATLKGHIAKPSDPVEHNRIGLVPPATYDLV